MCILRIIWKEVSCVFFLEHLCTSKSTSKQRWTTAQFCHNRRPEPECVWTIYQACVLLSSASGSIKCFENFNGPKHQNSLYDGQKWHYSFALLSHKYDIKRQKGFSLFPYWVLKKIISCLFWTLNTLPKSMFLQNSRWKSSRGLEGSRHASWPIKGEKTTHNHLGRG